MSNPLRKLYLEQDAISIMIQPLTPSSSMLVLCSRALGLSGLGTALSRRDFGTSLRLLRPKSLTGPTSHRSSYPLAIGTAPRLPPSEAGYRSLSLLRIRHGRTCGVPAYHRSVPRGWDKTLNPGVLAVAPPLFTRSM